MSHALLLQQTEKKTSVPDHICGMIGRVVIHSGRAMSMADKIKYRKKSDAATKHMKQSLIMTIVESYRILEKL